MNTDKDDIVPNSPSVSAEAELGSLFDESSQTAQGIVDAEKDSTSTSSTEEVNLKLFFDIPDLQYPKEKNDSEISKYMQTENWSVKGLQDLLRNGHDPNVAVTENDAHHTYGKAALPLLIATLSRNLSAVKLLLENGSKSQMRDQRCRMKGVYSYLGKNAIEEACMKGYLEIVEEMFKYEIKREDCYFALTSAVENDRIDIVHCLCKEGVKLDASDPLSKSALHIAVQMQNQEMIALLLSYKAAGDGRSNLPLVEACKMGNMEIVKMLLKGGCRTDSWKPGEFIHGNLPYRHTSPLCAAIKEGHDEIVKYLVLEERARVNPLISVFNSEIPICVAAQRGNINLVKFLFQNGANICNVGSMGDLVTDCACMGENIDVLKFVIEQGATLDARSNVMYDMVRDFNEDLSEIYDDMLKLILGENILVFYKEPLAELDGWEEFLSRFIGHCVRNPELFKLIIKAGCDRKVLYKLRKFEFIAGFYPEHPYGYGWSEEEEARYREYFNKTAQDIEDSEELRTFVDEIVGSPESLKVLCRQQIRDCLGTHISNKARNLPIAPYHKNYLLIPEM